MIAHIVSARGLANVALARSLPRLRLQVYTRSPHRTLRSVLHKCTYKSRADELRLNELCLRQRDENMARVASQIATVAASAAMATMVAS